MSNAAQAVAHRGWEFLSLSSEGGVTPESTWRWVEALMDHGRAYAVSQVLGGNGGEAAEQSRAER